MKITLGDTTVDMIATPGHSPGTLSYLFPVKDRRTHAGGRVLRRYGVQLPATGRELRHLPRQPAQDGEAAAAAGATVLMTNHTEFDRAYDRARIAQLPRTAGEKHPYETDTATVQRYFEMGATARRRSGCRCSKTAIGEVPVQRDGATHVKFAAVLDASGARVARVRRIRSRADACGPGSTDVAGSADASTRAGAVPFSTQSTMAPGRRSCRSPDRRRSGSCRDEEQPRPRRRGVGPPLLRAAAGSSPSTRDAEKIGRPCRGRSAACRRVR